MGLDQNIHAPVTDESDEEQSDLEMPITSKDTFVLEVCFAFFFLSFFHFFLSSIYSKTYRFNSDRSVWQGDMTGLALF